VINLVGFSINKNTHRLSTGKKSTRILLINEKQLVATGTHNELLIKSSYYRSIVENQQILAED